MPDLVDHDYLQVRSFLVEHGLRLGSVKYEPYEGSRAVWCCGSTRCRAIRCGATR